MISRFDLERAVMASDLPGHSRGIMLVLASKINRKTGRIHRSPSLRQLARETGIHRTTVLRHLPVLEDRGWIVRHPREAGERRDQGRRTHRPTYYELLIPGLVQGATGLGADRDQSLVQDAAELGADRDQSLVRGAARIQQKSSGSHQDNSHPQADDDLIAAVMQEAASKGRPVSKAQAGEIMRQVLTGRAIHTSAEAYLREALRRTPDKYLPARVLPRVEDLCKTCGSDKHLTALCPEQFDRGNQQ